MDIKLIVKETSGEYTAILIPDGINLNLMEVLKGSGYDVQASCGVMALCATCHINVLEPTENMSEAKDIELDMLDSLPMLHAGSRLSCQLKISPDLDGLVFEIVG